MNVDTYKCDFLDALRNWYLKIQVRSLIYTVALYLQIRHALFLSWHR